ncbi:MAG: sigma-54 interaction domain-containing protein [Clostridia bacterium]|jgi:transcriptional regulator with PAS, ATPase and Fis domain
MKSIAVVTDHAKNPVGFFLKENLETVLGGLAEVHNHYLDRQTGDFRIAEDVVIIMAREKALLVKPAVDDAKKIVLAKRTIRKSEIYRICSIPPGTRVLVVNDTYDTTMEFISLLYQIGIDHLDLVPYDPRHDYPDIMIAITPGERLHVPKHIENVLDTGNRLMDISTFIQIIDMLGITDPGLHQRLYRYSEDQVPLESGINSQYRQLYLRNLELDSIMNISHEGILLVDTAGLVSLHNKALTGMLGTGQELAGQPLEKLVQEPLLSVLGKPRIDDELVQYKGRSFMLTATRLEHFGQPSGTYYNFRDITYIRRLEQNLNARLKASGFVSQYVFDDIKTSSPAMLKCKQMAGKFATSSLPVFISGESGTGKELFAHAIHAASDRRNQSFVAFNCAAVPESLVESELFGYEAGAFTGALKAGKPGLFEEANNGTIFLDEIGDMPLAMQAKMLRVLQERQVMRIGSGKIINIDIRVIAATNQDLEDRIADGRFREDLYYRLNVLPLRIPPLRERPDDIPLLFGHFSNQNADKPKKLSAEAREALLGYPWPGNVRELWNVASYASFLADGGIGINALPEHITNQTADFDAEVAILTREGHGQDPLEILAAIHESCGQGSGAAGSEAGRTGVGRAGLQAVLATRGISLGEGRIRSLLDLLNHRGLAETQAGRRGTRLTLKGRQVAIWLANR